MKRIIVMLLLMSFLLSSCLYGHDKSTDNQNPTNIISSVISTSGMPIITNNMSGSESNNEIATLAPNGYYYSSDVENIIGYNYDFSQFMIKNSNNCMFLPYEPKDDITGSLEIYLKKIEKEYDMLPDDIECDKIANEFLTSLKIKTTDI